MPEVESEQPAVPLTAVLSVTTKLAFVPAAVLIGLAGFDALDWRMALGGLAIVVGAAVVSARLWLSDVNRAAFLLQRLRESGVAESAVAQLPSSAPLFSGILQVGRAWQEDSDALRERLSASETALERLPDPLLVIDTDRRVVRANAAASRLLGDGLLGRDLGATLRDPSVLAAVDGAVTQHSETDVDFDLPVPVERQFIARVRALPAPMADGGIVVLTLYDVTAMKRSEQMRADFVANASHELRTPLAALIGYIETLRGPAAGDTEAQDRFLAIMGEQADRMSRLVDDLLSLSRIELNEHSAPVDPVAVDKIALKAAEVLELRARQRGVTIDVELGAGLPPIAGDEYELMQVFQNLIDNAIKYGDQGSTIRVAVGRVEDRAGDASPRHSKWQVYASVTDQGEGIPREHIPRLTERFYRVDAARSRELGGTGLGLAIVKHILNRHRGTLAIDSEVGEGSTFTAYFPAARERAELPASDAAD